MRLTSGVDHGGTGGRPPPQRERGGTRGREGREGGDPSQSPHISIQIYAPAANAIVGRIGRIVLDLHLLLTKCVLILLYSLEACSVRKTD